MLPYIFATRGQAPGSVLGLFAPLKQRELRSWACQAWQLDAIPGVFNRATPAIVNQTPEQTAPGVRVPREEGVPWHDGGGEGTRTLTALRPTDFKSVVSAIPPRPRDAFVILRCGSNTSPRVCSRRILFGGFWATIPACRKDVCHSATSAVCLQPNKLSKDSEQIVQSPYFLALSCTCVVGGDERIRTADRGFADPRLNHLATSPWSGRRDSNSRPSPWQGDALPLSHFRVS